MPRFALSFASLLFILCLLACTGASDERQPAQTPDRPSLRLGPAPTLQNTDEAYVWVYLFRDSDSNLAGVMAAHPSERRKQATYACLLDGATYCGPSALEETIHHTGWRALLKNTSSISWSGVSLRSPLVENHTRVENVSVFPASGPSLRCQRNIIYSTADESIFCV